MYFKNFPRMNYEFEINDTVEYRQVIDIMKNVRFKELLDAISVFDLYDIENGETLEIVAEKVYGKSSYHWILAIANDIYDYRTDMPLSQEALNKYVNEKYGSDADSLKPYYFQKDGIVYSTFETGSVQPTNREYETQLNESKRRLIIPHPNVVSQIVEEFKRIL